MCAKDSAHWNVTLVCNLLLGGLTKRLGATANDDVGLHAEREKSFDGVLRRLCLLSTHLRHIRAVAPGQRVLWQAKLELSQGLDEGHGLDVADSATKFNKTNLGLGSAAIYGVSCRSVDPLDDLASDVRDNLHCLPEVVSTSLLSDDRVVDLACGDVVVTTQRQEHHPFVVAQIQIGLTAIIKDEDLSMLIRAHQTSVDVEIGVHLDCCHSEAVAPEERTDRRGGDALAQRAAHTA
mmetsp:Transcript_78629/g.163440  ORF Transcript_78629/g.163440 Transcript_78629/m.163440 type:complete len:236 (+) Transcript_78629:1097-1804(+)